MMSSGLVREPRGYCHVLTPGVQRGPNLGRKKSKGHRKRGQGGEWRDTREKLEREEARTRGKSRAFPPEQVPKGGLTGPPSTSPGLCNSSRTPGPSPDRPLPNRPRPMSERTAGSPQGGRDQGRWLQL